MSDLVLSLFPNIGLLDSGFESAGFCVVRGPDLIWGGDIRSFNPPEGKFDGVIGGPPCQDFSRARRAIPPTGYGLTMLAEFERCVEAAQPVWWLMENVDCVPDMKINGYSWQRLDLQANWFGLSQRRLRHIQFGSKDGTSLVRNSSMQPSAGSVTPTITASDHDVPMDRVLREMGLPADFDIPVFRRKALREAIGNGVPLPMAAALADMVLNRQRADSIKLCACGCGRMVSDKATYADTPCRMRAMRRRKAA